MFYVEGCTSRAKLEVPRRGICHSAVASCNITVTVAAVFLRPGNVMEVLACRGIWHSGVLQQPEAMEVPVH
jgi:hypothetical protein